MAKPRLFLVFAGPRYDVVYDFQLRLERLSERFQGILFTSTPRPLNMQFGDFSLVTAGSADSGRVASNVAYFYQAISLAKRNRNRRAHVDLVVAWDPLKTGLLGLLVARIVKAKFIAEVNGDFAAEGNYADQRNRTRAWLTRRVYVALAKFVLKRADGIKLLYPSQLYFYAPKTSSQVVCAFPDFLDLKPFRNLGEEPVVLFAGFPFYRKGVDILIKAFKKVAPRHPTWKLKIMGWFKDLAELNAHIDNHPQITHHPAVHNREVPEHIGRCGIFVLPSRSEGLPRVLLEAMAAGKPRIATRVAGIPECIEHGIDGFLIEPEGVDELATLLDKLMSDGNLRHRIGAAAAERAAREFTIERHLLETFSFYRKVLEP